MNGQNVFSHMLCIKPLFRIPEYPCGRIKSAGTDVYKIKGLIFLQKCIYIIDDSYLLELYDEAHSTVAETRFRGLAELEDFIIL